MSFQLTKLANGVRVATAEMPHMESVSIGVWSTVGSRHDSVAHNGIAHFAEHLLFKGTRNRSAKQIASEIESVGGSINAFTALDHTCYEAKGPAERMDVYVSVLLDMYFHSTFPSVEVERERQVIEEEIAMYREQPSQHVDDLLSATMWPGASLGRPVTGTRASLEKIRRAELQKFARTYYSPGNTIVAGAGRLEHGALLALVKKAIPGRRSGGKAPRTRRFDPKAQKKGPWLQVDTRDIEQVHLAIGFHAFAREDQRRPALRLLSVILGENMSSRLWQELREKRGLCYSVQSEPVTLQDTGLFQLYVGIDAGNFEKCVKLILKELKKIAVKAPGKGEVRKACDYALGTSQVALEGTDHRMMWVGESVLAYNEIVDPSGEREILRSVTPEEIRSTAEAILSPGNLGAAIVGPVEQSPALKRLFSAW